MPIVPYKSIVIDTLATSSSPFAPWWFAWSVLVPHEVAQAGRTMSVRASIERDYRAKMTRVPHWPHESWGDDAADTPAEPAADR